MTTHKTSLLTENHIIKSVLKKRVYQTVFDHMNKTNKAIGAL